MSRGRKKLFLPLILLSLVTFFVTKTVVFSQTPSNYDVTVSPVFFDLSSTPGDTISDRVRIRNNTATSLPIKLEVKKLTGDVNGDLTLKSDNSDSSLSWIKFPSDTIVAKPLEWTDIPFTIQIPKDAAYGYYFAITFAQNNNSPLAKTGAAITGAAAVPVLLNVRKEGAKADAKILQFSTKSSVNEYLPVDFTVNVENVGNIHVKPHGNIFISNGGKDLAILDVNGSLASIIPGTRKTFNASWDDGFLVKEEVTEDGQVKLDKNGKPVEKLTINWNKLTSFRIGKYTANLLLVFDNGKRDVSLESTTTFWVFPYKAIIVIVILFIAGIIVLRLLLKYYVSREIKKRTKTE
ncbi:MAG: DUF916 domain-containing protein [Patescibacteria group bacterium]|nr:DUF916 domain-containing protein [Patescibacteria group bacterium]